MDSSQFVLEPYFKPKDDGCIFGGYNFFI